MASLFYICKKCSTAHFLNWRSSRPGCSVKRCSQKFFSKFTRKHLFQGLFFNKVAGLSAAALLKKSLTQVFACKFCKISKNTFSCRTPPVAASEADRSICVIAQKVVVYCLKHFAVLKQIFSFQLLCCF